MGLDRIHNGLSPRADQLGLSGAANDTQYVRGQIAYRPLDAVQYTLARKFGLKFFVDDQFGYFRDRSNATGKQP
jgi:hypothetical protein